MDRDYYKAYYDFERNHWWFKVRNHILFNQVKWFCKKKRLKKPNILNVGAATGKTTEDLMQLGNVISVEYDKETCDFLKKENDWQVINASITKLPFNAETFDIVCAFDVIEHVEDDVSAINELIRVCKTNGGIIASVPMYMFLWSDHDIVNHHKKRYTLKELSSLFLSNSKKGIITRKSYFNFFLFFPIVIFRIAERFFKTKNKGIKSDFSKSNNLFYNKILFFLFYFEVVLLKFINFPFGISGFIVWKKNK